MKDEVRRSRCIGIDSGRRVNFSNVRAHRLRSVRSPTVRKGLVGKVALADARATLNLVDSGLYGTRYILLGMQFESLTDIVAFGFGGGISISDLQESCSAIPRKSRE